MIQQTYKNKRVIWENKKEQIKHIAVSFLFVALVVIQRKTCPPLLFWSTLIFFGGAGLILLVRLLHPKNLFVTSDSPLGMEILEEQQRQREEDLGLFSFTEDGFYFNKHQEKSFYKWLDIGTVFAHEEDISYNQMCLDLFMSNGVVLELTEETPGWYQFKNRLLEHLPLQPFVWDREEPGYEPELTLLYDRKGRTQEAAEAVCYPE